MSSEKLLIEELNDVPPVPADSFSIIEKRINKKKVRKTRFYAVAATLFLAIGLTTFGLTKSNIITKQESTTMTTSISPEIEDELQIARDFVTGDDTDNRYDQYAFYEETDY